MMSRASKVRSSGHGSSEVVDGASGDSEGYELQSIVPPYFSGHGFLIRDFDTDEPSLQKGPLCPQLRVPQ